jgi:general secretion pathway protein G
MIVEDKTLTLSLFMKKTKESSVVPYTKKAGFTLLEMLIVVGLIAVIAGMAIGNMDAIFGGAKESAASTYVKSSMEVPLTSYKMHMGNYPSTAEMKGFAALLSPPAKRAERWKGPYLKRKDAVEDPWGNEYQYRYPGVKNKNGYDLWSYGPDGIESADDIGNWE